ncbi:MAG: ABC transporter permease [Actinomycetota bacterium]
MSATTAATTTAVPAARRLGPGTAIRNAASIARRNLIRIKSDPEQLTGATVQPLMFLTLFVFVFGGAIAEGGWREYLQFALPGILIQGISFQGFSTALGLNNDFEHGLIDRFRSLPIARSSVVAGRIMADSVLILWGTFVIVGFGMVLGFRFTGGLGGAVGSVLLVWAWGMTVCWPLGFIGILAKSPQAVNTGAFMIILPITFASSVFVPAASMPGPLRAFAEANPITKVAEAARGLMLGVRPGEPPLADNLIPAILWMVGIVAVFAPLAVWRYRKRAI